MLSLFQCAIQSLFCAEPEFELVLKHALCCRKPAHGKIRYQSMLKHILMKVVTDNYKSGRLPPNQFILSLNRSLNFSKK
jgi:hypothetical protein